MDKKLLKILLGNEEKSIKDLSIDELTEIKKIINEEINKKNNNDRVIYRPQFYDSSNYALTKYKNWAKCINAIDDTKKNGYAFLGTFMSIREENIVEKGAYVIELFDKSIKLYRITGDNEKEELLEGKTTSYVTFIRECKKITDL